MTQYSQEDLPNPGYLLVRRTMNVKELTVAIEENLQIQSEVSITLELQCGTNKPMRVTPGLHRTRTLEPGASRLRMTF
jgi:hypothetical protein